MSRVELKIIKAGTASDKRAVANKWKFIDSMMGEQYIMLSITSEIPIDWSVGDFCVFRGETYTLNYIPSVTQKSRSRERQDAYTYENIKFDSYQDELTRCIMLDITPTTGKYIAALGTNYTGSSRFQLFCGETTANGKTLTSVCALAAKMQANLDRMYGKKAWEIAVDTESTYKDSSGYDILVTHTDDKVMSFDNTTVAQALAEVHNTFDLDYCIKGRNIYIGYEIKDLTGDSDADAFVFGYGKGYPTHSDMNKGLFQIKRIANSQQKIVTRLRALGSTKNMPYRYYNKKYGGESNPDLSQTLFPTNLQLPDTFIPEGNKNDAAGTNSKWGHNKQRASYLRAVKGDTNDAYIDKNDDADNCIEGIREDCARWDGSNSELQEIYPTIEGATYGELRGALVEDQDGRTGQDSFRNYGDNERIDSLLAIGYYADNVLTDDANKGNGILPESGTMSLGITKTALIAETTLNYNSRTNGDFTKKDNILVGKDKTLFTIPDVTAGEYLMVPTGPSYDSVIYGFSISRDGISVEIGYQITIKQTSKATGKVSSVTYMSDFVSISKNDNIKEVALPEIPDVKNENPKVEKITVTESSDIEVVFTPIMRNVPSSFAGEFSLVYAVGKTRLGSQPYESEYTWRPVGTSEGTDETFHVFIKDMGFDITACWTNEPPVVAMKSGRCTGREFEIGENVEKVTYEGKKGYMLTLKRATDSTLNTYYPSATDPISPDDYFVLLNISMPDAYVKMAEVRLLKAATDYLADNSVTQFTYQPYIDNLYLQRNLDFMTSAGTPEKSIFWRLYAGLKFSFRGIPAREEDPLPLIEITIKQVTIQMGEGITPKVEIILNDDIQQSTLQRLTTAVDRIYNGSLFASGGGSGNGGVSITKLLSLIQTEGAKLFLSKTKDDTANGLITFLKGIKGDGRSWSIDDFGTALLNALTTGNIKSPRYTNPDIIGGQGYSMWEDENGKSHIVTDFFTARIKAYFAALEIMKLTYSSGNIFIGGAGCRLSRVVPLTNEEGRVYAYRCYWLKDDGEKSTVNEWHVGDQAMCRTFNIEEGRHENVSNTYYWRLVTSTGEEQLEDDKDYHYIDLSNERFVTLEDENGRPIYNSDGVNAFIGYDTSVDNDDPSEDDEVAQVGSQADNTRQSIIQLVAIGDDAPSINIYDGINDYELAKHQVIHMSPKHFKVNSRLFELYSGSLAGEGNPMFNYRKDYSPGDRCYYYDVVPYNGETWICLVEPRDSYTTEIPSEDSDVWKKFASRGRDAYLYRILLSEGSVVIDSNGNIAQTEKIEILTDSNGNPLYLGDKLIWQRGSDDTSRLIIEGFEVEGTANRRLTAEDGMKLKAVMSNGYQQVGMEWEATEGVLIIPKSDIHPDAVRIAVTLSKDENIVENNSVTIIRDGQDGESQAYITCDSDSAVADADSNGTIRAIDNVVGLPTDIRCFLGNRPIPTSEWDKSSYIKYNGVVRLETMPILPMSYGLSILGVTKGSDNYKITWQYKPILVAGEGRKVEEHPVIDNAMIEINISFVHERKTYSCKKFIPLMVSRKGTGIIELYNFDPVKDEDGNDVWTSEWSSVWVEGMRWKKWSYDGGKTWYGPIKFIGEDGKGLNIKGRAYKHIEYFSEIEHLNQHQLIIGSRIWLVDETRSAMRQDNKDIITSIVTEVGDAYIMQEDGHLWVLGEDKWEDNGKVQIEGKDAIEMHLEPSSTILNQSYEPDGGGNYPLERGRVKVVATKGDKALTAQIVKVESDDSGAAHSTVITDYATTPTDTIEFSVRTYKDDKDNIRYYNGGSFLVTATAGGITRTMRFDFRCNLLGEYREVINGDIRKEIATRTVFSYDENGNFVTNDYNRDLFSSAQEWRQWISDTKDGVAINKTLIRQSSDEIRLGYYKNNSNVTALVLNENGSTFTGSVQSEGNGWKLNQDGSGWLANKNITWSKDGKAKFVGEIQADKGKFTGEVNATSGLFKNVKWGDVDGVYLEATANGIAVKDNLRDYNMAQRHVAAELQSIGKYGGMMYLASENGNYSCVYNGGIEVFHSGVYNGNVMTWNGRQIKFHLPLSGFRKRILHATQSVDLNTPENEDYEAVMCEHTSGFLSVILPANAVDGQEILIYTRSSAVNIGLKSLDKGKTIRWGGHSGVTTLSLPQNDYYAVRLIYNNNLKEWEALFMR